MRFAKSVLLSGGVLMISLPLFLSPLKTQSQTTTFPDSTHVNKSLYIDSNWIKNQVSTDTLLTSFSDSILQFYRNRNFNHAWFDSTEISESARSFMNTLHSFENINSGNRLIIFPVLKQNYSVIEGNPDNQQILDSLKRQMELLFTGNFFYFANFVYKGSNKQMKNINWFIPNKKISVDSAIATLLKPRFLTIADPEIITDQYALLQNSLRRYYNIEKQGDWAIIDSSVKVLKMGDKNPVIPAIKRKLFLLDDLATIDSSKIFTKELKQAVITFEKRHGLTQDGIIGPKVLLELNKPIRERILQILVNLERCKWIHAKQNNTFIIVNIPEFKMHVYEGSKVNWSCSVIVGKEGTNTIVFTGNIKYIVFSPYWNVPQSIIKAEIIPETIKNPGYISRHNMEVRDGKKIISPGSITWSKYEEEQFPYSIRQKPGGENSLGYAKFMFPNEYNIYLHDTPQKSLFKQNNRMFSHGCIRISEPLKLAQFLLKADTTWTEETIKETMYKGEEKIVVLKKPVPVFIGYLTCWVDENFKLNFRNDIYGHDIKFAKQLFILTEPTTLQTIQQ